MLYIKFHLKFVYNYYINNINNDTKYVVLFEMAKRLYLRSFKLVMEAVRNKQCVMYTHYFLLVTHAYYCICNNTHLFNKKYTHASITVKARKHKRILIAHMILQTANSHLLKHVFQRSISTTYIHNIQFTC